MALRNIVMDGDEILKKKCRPVTSFDDRLAQLLDDMGETVLENDGLGLAGPQVGVLRRVFVAVDESSLEPAARKDAENSVRGDGPADGAGAGDADNAEDDAPAGDGEDGDWDEFEYEPVVMEFINPEIIETEGAVRGYEGCLSFPGKFGAIERPERVRIRAQDRSGDTFEYEATGMMARCLCHETDHLNGVTIDELAEYFYDPEVPHDLDESLTGRAGDEEEQA